MVAQQRGRRARVGRVLEHRPQRRRLGGPAHQEDQLARPVQRSEPGGERPVRHVLGAAERRRRVLPGHAGERHHRHAGGHARGRLVERDVPVAAQPEHREVDRRLLEDGGVTHRLGGRVVRGAVDGADRAERDALELRAQLRREAARVAGPRPAYSSSCRTVAVPGGRCPARACARRTAYIACGDRPVGRSMRECGRAQSRFSTSSAATVPTRRGSASTSGAGAGSDPSGRRCTTGMLAGFLRERTDKPNQACAGQPMTRPRGSRSMAATPIPRRNGHAAPREALHPPPPRCSCRLGGGRDRAVPDRPRRQSQPVAVDRRRPRLGVLPGAEADGGRVRTVRTRSDPARGARRPARPAGPEGGPRARQATRHPGHVRMEPRRVRQGAASRAGRGDDRRVGRALGARDGRHRPGADRGHRRRHRVR